MNCSGYAGDDDEMPALENVLGSASGNPEVYGVYQPRGQHSKTRNPAQLAQQERYRMQCEMTELNEFLLRLDAGIVRPEEELPLPYDIAGFAHIS